MNEQPTDEKIEIPTRAEYYKTRKTLTTLAVVQLVVFTIMVYNLRINFLTILLIAMNLFEMGKFWLKTYNYWRIPKWIFFGEACREVIEKSKKTVD